MTNTDERADRLAAQLRANLHRRKAQARAVAQAVDRQAPEADRPDRDAATPDGHPHD